jgi:hypothetical protein
MPKTNIRLEIRTGNPTINMGPILNKNFFGIKKIYGNKSFLINTIKKIRTCAITNRKTKRVSEAIPNPNAIIISKGGNIQIKKFTLIKYAISAISLL